MAELPSARSRILEAARGAFISHGYAGANMRDIAREAEVSMGGLYHYFSNKEELFRCLLQGGDIAPYLSRLAALVMAPDFPENLSDLARVIRGALRDNRDYFKLVYVDILEFQGRNVRPVIDLFRQAYTGFAAEVVERKMAEGRVERAHPQVLLRVATDLLIHFWLEEIMLDKSLAAELGLSDDDLLEQMCDILLHGLLARDGPAPGAEE